MTPPSQAGTPHLMSAEAAGKASSHLATPCAPCSAPPAADPRSSQPHDSEFDSAGCAFLGGPTASGKSEIALLFAEQTGAEIVTVDSMQVYRGLDVGTDKPSAEVRARVAHHLIDVSDFQTTFSANDFRRLAIEAIQAIRSRGRIPLLAGGTGLYFKALIEGLGAAPGAIPELRRDLEGQPIDRLLEELQARDPETYGKIDRRNPRRIIRAVEVIRMTGRPFSAQRSAWVRGGPGRKDESCWFRVIARKPDDLKKRIDERVDRMFREGLIEETERRLAEGLRGNPTAMQAIGYRQVVEYLDGQRSLAETVRRIKTRTWQYARRQLTWFRRQAPAARWRRVEPGESAGAVAADLARDYRDFMARKSLDLDCSHICESLGTAS